jgi:hypothetical protein
VYSFQRKLTAAGSKHGRARFELDSQRSWVRLRPL